MEDNVIKDIRYKKSIKNLFRLKNENRAIKTEKLETSGTILNMKKRKSIANQ